MGVYLNPGNDANRQEAFIPNQEIADEYENAVEDGGWGDIANAIQDSEELLYATF